MTISAPSSVAIVSNTETKFGWLSVAPSRASRRKRARLSSGASVFSRLTATSLPSRSSSASQTVAIPPVPSRRMTR